MAVTAAVSASWRGRGRGPRRKTRSPSAPLARFCRVYPVVAKKSATHTDVSKRARSTGTDTTSRSEKSANSASTREGPALVEMPVAPATPTPTSVRAAAATARPARRAQKRGLLWSDQANRSMATAICATVSSELAARMTSIRWIRPGTWLSRRRQPGAWSG